MKRLVLTQITGRREDRASADERHHMAQRIGERIAAQGRSISDLIASTSLYFRVSIIGSCNLSCAFCHNEGGPETGRLHRTVYRQALDAAKYVGFSRVQLTGGEPLLNPHVADYVCAARETFADVGVTTNGTFLDKRLDDLINAGITRIHVSLQRETLMSEIEDLWSMPEWLSTTVERCKTAGIALRFNLPIARRDIDVAHRFLIDSGQGFDVNAFALMSPNARSTTDAEQYLNELRILAESVNRRRTGQYRGTVRVRSYLNPTGVRCSQCSERANCTEQSRSLRLGVDGILRPCLATRRWDLELSKVDPLLSMTEAALFALDFAGPDRILQ